MSSGASRPTFYQDIQELAPRLSTKFLSATLSYAIIDCQIAGSKRVAAALGCDPFDLSPTVASTTVLRFSYKSFLT